MRHSVVYPLAKQIDYTELKYSLRSIEKYLDPPFEVVIVGDTMPDWINNVVQIELGDIPGQPNYSVRRKIMAALERTRELLLLNDDIYLLKSTDFNFPYYSSGLLKTKGESGAKALVKHLEYLRKPTKYYGHYPVIYKRDFVDVLYFANEVPTKSAYCNVREVESIEVPDCKIMTAKKPDYIREFIKDKPCFSTGLYSIKSCLPVLEELFPEPSKYEI